MTRRRRVEVSIVFSIDFDEDVITIGEVLTRDMLHGVVEACRSTMQAALDANRETWAGRRPPRGTVVDDGGKITAKLKEIQ